MRWDVQLNFSFITDYNLHFKFGMVSSCIIMLCTKYALQYGTSTSYWCFWYNRAGTISQVSSIIDHFPRLFCQSGACIWPNFMTSQSTMSWKWKNPAKNKSVFPALLASYGRHYGKWIDVKLFFEIIIRALCGAIEHDL